MTNYPSMQRFATTANSNLQAFQSMAEIMLSASERLAALNVEAARSFCAFAASQTLPINGEELRDRLTGKGNGNTQNQGLEQAAEYLRNVNEVCLRTQSEVAELSTQHLNEISNSMSSLFGEVGAMMPTGSMGTLLKPAPTQEKRKAA